MCIIKLLKATLTWGFNWTSPRVAIVGIHVEYYGRIVSHTVTIFLQLQLFTKIKVSITSKIHLWNNEIIISLKSTSTFVTINIIHSFQTLNMYLCLFMLANQFCRCEFCQGAVIALKRLSKVNIKSSTKKTRNFRNWQIHNTVTTSQIANPCDARASSQITMFQYSMEKFWVMSSALLGLDAPTICWWQFKNPRSREALY